MADISKVQTPDGTTYNIKDTTARGLVVANPTLAGTESDLTGLQVNGTKYKVPSGGGGGGTPYDSNPAMDGTASPGSSTAYARGDHVHPTDTTRQAKITASGVLIGNGSGGVTAKTLDTSSLTNDNNHVPTSGVVMSALNAKADQTDLASIHATGTTNTTGDSILAGRYFYLDGTLARAITTIASGATFTLNTNYEPITAGGLNALFEYFNPLAQKFAMQSVGADSGTYRINFNRTSDAALLLIDLGYPTSKGSVYLVTGVGASGNMVTAKLAGETISFTSGNNYVQCAVPTYSHITVFHAFTGNVSITKQA